MLAVIWRIQTIKHESCGKNSIKLSFSKNGVNEAKNLVYP